MSNDEANGRGRMVLRFLDRHAVIYCVEFRNIFMMALYVEAVLFPSPLNGAVFFLD